VAALARGELDCAAWHGPHHEYLQGFHKAAPRCYAPAWRAPSARMMLCLNRKAFERVPAILRIIINAAAAEEDHRLTAEFAAMNALALRTLRRENGIVPEALPAPVLERLRGLSREAVAELAARSPLSRMIAKSYAEAMGEG
jgi:TRAP-type mannitol/chloroaromatic compound transport system substrate-binding protein